MKLSTTDKKEIAKFLNGLIIQILTNLCFALYGMILGMIIMLSILIN
jgi:hypothetical protein